MFPTWLNWIREKPAAILVWIIFWEVLLRIFSPAAKFPRRCQPDKYTGQQQDHDDQNESHVITMRFVKYKSRHPGPQGHCHDDPAVIEIREIDDFFGNDKN